MKKPNMKSFCEKYVTSQNIRMVILFFPLLLLFISQCRNGEISLSTFLDTGVLISFLLVFLCDSIATAVSRVIRKKYEDTTKLFTDYAVLTKKYSREKMVEYKDVKFPVVCLAHRSAGSAAFDITMNTSGEKYRLPKQIEARSDDLMKAHSFSTVYNNMNVRVNDLLVEGNRITLTYSMTTYFDSLITNRVMDFPWENGKSIREIYEPGPFLSSLSQSRLSNHLGFNGFIETRDGKFIFVKRSGNVSIGKNTLANSIGASLKVEYCLDENRRLTPEGLHNAIRAEIYDELRIDVDDKASLLDGIFAFYRDIVEGGKPQFLFYYKWEESTFDEFKEMFEKAIKREEIKKNKTIIDGKEVIPFSLDQLKSSVITPGTLTVPSGETYPMMPSASASVVMLLDYFSCR